VRLPLHLLSKAEQVAAFAVLLGLVVTLQVAGGAYASGFGGYPDEPAHVVTSLMVREFIADLDFSHPWRFAQEYYFHYPKVAIGHWPPVFYGALGIWFLIFDASRGTALMFITFVAATTASIIYFTGKRLIGRWAGVLAAALFVASPLVQESSARVMTEHLSTLGMLVSTLCFARFARTGRIGDGLAFGTVAAVAILTHANAWALALVPGITIALTNRWDLLRRPGIWLAAVPVLVFCVPWYVFTLHMAEYGLLAGGSRFWIQAPDFGRSIYAALGFAVLLFASVGLWTTRAQIMSRAEPAPEWAALAALAAAAFVLHCIIPTGAETRYMVTVVPSIVLFSAAGIDGIARRFSTRRSVGVVRIGLALALTAVFCMESFALPLQLKNDGYDTLVHDVEARVLDAPQVWLVSSGSTGEGCLVAAVALQEGRPKSYVLRGKTILAGGDWLWSNTEDRFDTPEKLAKLLDEIPVTIVVIDDRVPPEHQRPYHDRLRKLVASEGGRWKLLGSYPQTQNGIVFANSLHVYARRPVGSLSIPGPMILDRLKPLMDRTELR
jgi:Dolichyl-phosphate-mannose-protein mannosyltransferase